MSKPPIKNIDPRRVTGVVPAQSIREAQAALVYQYLENSPDGMFFNQLEELMRHRNELNRPEIKAAVDLLMSLHLVTIKIAIGRVIIHVK